MKKLFIIAAHLEHKLAQYSDTFYDPKGEKESPGKLQMGETTIIVDPKKTTEETKPEQTPAITPDYIAQRLRLEEPLAFYNPGKSQAETMLAKLPGYQYMDNIGLVPPDKINTVNQALSKGWQYAGAGYGLVPPDYFMYLKQNKYV